MRLIKKNSKRALAFFISVLMIISMLPVGIFTAIALSDPALITDIADKEFFAEQATEFTFTTTAGAKKGAMVLGSFTLLDENGADARSAVKTLEYWDVTGGCYREFYGDFGPADTGFPLTDATSKFRVTFKEIGKYTVKAAMINFEGRSVLVSAEDVDITVKPYASELTTDIDTKTFINNTEVEFTYSTVANAQKNTMVLGTFSVLDANSNDAQNCIKKLEYWDVTNNCYREFYGDFGPADTGFPLTDAASKFRVTFSKAGTYTVNAAMKRFDNGEILCSNAKTITVQTNNSVLTTDIATKEFEVNEEVEFTYTTEANDFAGTYVLGKFSVLDADSNDAKKCIKKLEYWDTTNNCYREFYGDFGPADTGFPLTDATSKFRVAFNTIGKYNVRVQMTTPDGKKVISENTTTIEVKDTNAPEISEITGNPTDWTNSNVKLKVVATDKGSGIAGYRMDKGNWQTTDEFTVVENGKYTFSIKDYADNITTEEIDVKYIDKTAPTNVKISYSSSVIEKIIENITFGFYNPSVTVTVTADDNTSGVDYFKWEYTREDNASEKNADKLGGTISTDKIEYSENNLTAKASFEIPAQARGYITVTATDRAGNSTTNTHKDNTTVVVDTIAPEVNVAYETADENTKTRFVDENNKDIGDFDKATRAYYNGKVTAKITIDEANFFEGVTAKDGVIHNVGIKLTKTDDDGKSTVYEYLPKDAVQKYDGAAPVYITWNTSGDKHTFSIDYEDSADYVLGIEYTDLSENDAKISANDGKSETKTYESKMVTVDTIDPVVKVEYSNKNVIQTVEGREYYDAEQIAKITVTEHNFRSEDFVVKVTAKDVAGADVNVNDYEAYAKDAANWEQNGDVWTLKTDGMKFDIDANYTFGYTYEDLAHNPAAEYKSDKFTLDRVKPYKLTVEYNGDVKTTILDKILNVITFGYYDAKVKVTVYADDDVAGVDYFIYSYIKADGVSNVNASLENQKITPKTRNGKTFSGTFEIPKDILQNTNQFNGIVKFTAVDRAGNKSDEKADSRRIIVDDIAPISTVTFSDPVQKVNDISYYDGPIKATVVINEANFYSEDVKIVVTKDGANIPVRVDWSDNSVDVHTGTFTLDAPENHSGDGNYIVNVTYADRSSNEMAPFVSNQLTIDTKAPVISVSNVKNQSANNDETISFAVSVADDNIALEGFKPVLKAVVKKDDGDNRFEYETMSVDLGGAATTTNAEGETVYTYSVNNLTVDGFYSLVCTAVDYANHKVSAINSAAEGGGNATVETMNFSVNREGSVFWIETEHNDKYTDKTFTDKLNGAYANDKVAVKLHEINVDKVDENAAEKTVFTLNDGSKSSDVELKENENYSKNMIVGTGGWYENIYTLENSNFDHDGVYSLNVITYDKAENSNINTKTESGTISFTLDRTKPVVSANVKSGQRVNDTKFWVEFEVTEANLDAKTLAVKLVNKKGEKVETKVEELGNNEYKFLVDSGLNYSIEISAKDLAGNESELYKVKNLTVSTNFLVLWYANTSLFWGSIGIVILLTGSILLLVFFKKKKKNQDR